MEASEGVTGLCWAIKRSFVDYVGRMPDGRMSVMDGASMTELAEMVWEPAAPSAGTWGDDADHVFAFRGDVRYGGHGGLLFVQVADPWVAIRGDQGEMSVVDSFSNDDGARLPLVTFTVDSSVETGEARVVTASDVRLTVEGTHIFNTVYGEGEQFEPLTITWPIAAPSPA